VKYNPGNERSQKCQNQSNGSAPSVGTSVKVRHLRSSVPPVVLMHADLFRSNRHGQTSKRSATVRNKQDISIQQYENRKTGIHYMGYRFFYCKVSRKISIRNSFQLDNPSRCLAITGSSPVATGRKGAAGTDFR
jgi:hypothetical protein